MHLLNGGKREKNVEQNKAKQKVGLKPLRQTEERKKIQYKVQSFNLCPI